jgi:hypothetical protein
MCRSADPRLLRGIGPRNSESIRAARVRSLLTTTPMSAVGPGQGRFRRVLPRSGDTWWRSSRNEKAWGSNPPLRLPRQVGYLSCSSPVPACSHTYLWFMTSSRSLGRLAAGLARAETNTRRQDIPPRLSIRVRRRACTRGGTPLSPSLIASLSRRGRVAAGIEGCGFGRGR